MKTHEGKSGRLAASAAPGNGHPVQGTRAPDDDGLTKENVKLSLAV